MPDQLKDLHWCWLYPHFAPQFDQLEPNERKSEVRSVASNPPDFKIAAAIKRKEWQTHARSNSTSTVYYKQVERLAALLARKLEEVPVRDRKDRFSRILGAFANYLPGCTGRDWVGPDWNFAALYNGNAFFVSKNRAFAEEVLGWCAHDDDPSRPHYAKLSDLTEPRILQHWEAAGINVEEMLEAIVMTDVYELLGLAGFWIKNT